MAEFQSVGIKRLLSRSNTRTCAEPSIVQIGVASTFPVRLT